MKYQVKASKNLQHKTDCLVVMLKQNKVLSSQQIELNKLTDNSINRLQKSGLLSGQKTNL